MSLRRPTSPAGRILVIEDQREIADVLRAYLERAGFEVICAFDGEQGAQALRRRRPDLVFLDLLLPKRDGRDLLDAMSGADRPALVVASAQVEARRALAADARVDAILDKPFDPNQAVAMVVRVMRAHPGAEASE